MPIWCRDGVVEETRDRIEVNYFSDWKKSRTATEWKLLGPRYTTRIVRNKMAFFSDEFGLRSPVIRKTLDFIKMKSDTSVAARVCLNLNPIQKGVDLMVNLARK